LLPAAPKTRPLRALGWTALAAALTYPAIQLGLLLQMDGVALFWPAVGVAAGLALATAGTDRAGVVAGVLLALAIGNATQGRSLETSAVFMSGNVAEALALAWALERKAGGRFGLDSWRAVAWLMGGGCAVAFLVGLPAAALLIRSGHALMSYPEALWVWWSSHAIGLIVAAPLTLLAVEILAVEILGGRADGSNGSPRGRPASVLIFAGLLAALAPMALTTIWGAAAWFEQRRQAEIRHVERSAALLATAVDMELRALIGAVRLVANSAELRDPGLADAEARLREAAAQLGGHLVLVDRSYRQIVNTYAPDGAALPVTTNPEAYREAFETGQAGVGDLVTGTVSRAMRFTIRVPVVVGGEARYVLAYAPPDGTVIEVLRRLPLPPGWLAAVIDANGLRMARSEGHERAYGTPATPSFGARLTERSGVVQSVDIDGRASITAYRRMEASGWRALVWAPQAVLEAPIRSGYLALALIVALALLSSLGLAWLLGLALGAPARRLLEVVHDVGAGQTPAFAPTPMQEANRIGEALVEAARQRREASAALKESQERLAAILDALPLGIALIDAQGRTLVGNAVYRRFVPDRVPSRDEARPWNWVAEDAGGHALERRDYPAARALRGERVWPGVEFLFRGDAERGPFWTRVAALPIAGPEGSAAAVVIADIDAQKRAELALAESERRARGQAAEIASIYDASPVGLAVLDRDLRYQRINASLAAMNGVPAEEHIGRTVREVVPDLADTAEEKAQRIFETGDGIVGLELAGATTAQPGVKRHWVEHWTPLKDAEGRVTGISVLVDEITSRKRAEERLLESEGRLAAALRAGRLGVYDYDPRTGALTWDALVYDLWGLPPGRPIGCADFEAGIHPDDLAEVRARLAAALEPGAGGRLIVEFRLWPLDGGPMRWVHGDGDVAFEDGAAVRIVGTVQDVTEAREAAERIATIRDALSAEEPKAEPLPETREAAAAPGPGDAPRAAFAASELLEAAPGWAFDQVTRLAASVLQAPTSLITVLTRDSQLFLGAYGSEGSRSRPLSTSYCRRVIESEAPVSIHDARANPLAAGKDGGKDGFVAYLGVPVSDPNGVVVASLCVADRQARAWTVRDLTTLKGVARLLMREIESHAARAAIAAREAALRVRQERFEAAEEATGGLVYDWNLTTGEVWRSEGFARLTGYGPNEAPATPEGWQALLHPEDRLRIDGRSLDSVVGDDGRYSAEYRIRHKDGRWVWIWDRGRAARGADGALARCVGASVDITERKQREEQIGLLMREVNHRSKNMLGIVQAIARQTAVGAPADFVERFGERIHALAANQDLLVHSDWKGVEVGELAAAQLAPLKDLIGARIAIGGPRLRLNPVAAQAVGLALHELATNAVKHGSLSNDDGVVSLTWSLEADRFAIAWRERGGPWVSPPTRKGFGSTVIGHMARASLFGEVDLDFAPEGLSWTLACPAERALEEFAPRGPDEGAASS
jgi:PAS domain S-box-containing protein